MQIGAQLLTLEAIERVVFSHEPITLAPEACLRVEAAAAYVRQMAQSGRAVYGVTTGFGANRDQVIAPEDAELLQERLIMSHACGVGPALPRPVVRAMMLLRINALAQGHSGVRLCTLQTLVQMLNAGVHPVIPEMGSVGASGDLCPLAHMCLPLLGLGEAEFQGQLHTGAQAMAQAQIPTTGLTYKEGLALLNGTQAMNALGVVVAARFRRLLDCADAVGAMSLEAVAGRLEAMDARIHRVRRRKGQLQSAANVLRMLQGSALAGAAPGAVPGKVEYVQDSYCLRCLPQVHGASRDVLEHVLEVLVEEANAVTDNPLVFVPGDEGTQGLLAGTPGVAEGGILSGGNFHGQPLAMALDYLKIAIAELGSISERRSAKLTDKYFSEGLPAFLVTRPGLNSGMMIPQYVAAALVSENKHQASAASVDSIPTSANMEDHVSMGMHAGLHAWRMVQTSERIVGIEYLIAAQALDLRKGHVLGEGTAAALEALREVVPFLEHDRVMYPDIEAATALVRDGVPGRSLAGVDALTGVRFT